MQSAEIELKFPIADLAHLQSLLPGLGFLLDTPRTFEHNTLYDTPARALRESRQLLRIRRYGELWTLTHKSVPPQSPDSDPNASARYKVRIETETQLSDGPALGVIFEQLGYSPVFRYEKFRTEWSQVTSTIEGPLFSGLLASGLPTPNSHCHLVIDETPIGDYAELEGPPAWIDETLAKLGVDPNACLTESYGKLFLAWKERTSSSAENLTFEEISAAVAETLQPSLR
jgi:adenylate cyclase, class 2